MATHQLNHYVPASYFRPWCNDDGRFTYFRWWGSKFIVDTTTPQYVTKEKLLYGLHGAPDDLVTAMETKFFTPLIDQPGADILKILINAGPGKLTGDQRHVWTKYVMALHTRRPEAIRLAREVGRQTLINTLGNDPEYAQMKTDGMPDSLLDFVAPWIIENFGMLNAPAIVDHEPTHNIIMGMKWWCVDFSLAKYDLLTGDRPLIWPMGANRPEFYFALPLSPCLCFFATKTASIEKMFRDSYRSRLARQVNEAIVSQASEYVYSAHSAHSKFVGRRLKQNAVA